MTAVAEVLSPAELRKLTVKLEKEAARRASENKLSSFKAYFKQREFFAAGKTHRERLLMAANRFGKTECGAAEMSYHLTGQYPPDWPGKRFDKPVRAWAAGVTSETTRDVVQAKLIGPPFTESEWGQGMVPKSCIVDIAPARGIPSVYRDAGGGRLTLTCISGLSRRTPAAAGYRSRCGEPSSRPATSCSPRPRFSTSRLLGRGAFTGAGDTVGP